MSKVIKNFLVQVDAPSPAAGPLQPPAARGRLPRGVVQISGQTVAVGEGAAGAGVAGAPGSSRPGGTAGLRLVPPAAGVVVGAAVPAPGTAAAQEQVDQILARTQAKADLMLRQAEERAGLLIDQAVEGAQSLIEEERLRAREEGYREGLEAAQADAEALRREAEEVRSQAVEARQQLFAESREEVARLALAVAQQVIRQELAADPVRLLPLVDEALERVRGEEQATLRLNPAAAQALEPGREELAARHGLGDLRVVADGGLEPGDLEVTSPSGSVDVRMERQLEVLGETLSGVVRHG